MIDKKLNKDLIAYLYPVGHILTTTNSQNPVEYLGIGTWEEFATGRTLVGVDTNQTEFNVVEKTGGAKTHTLTASEIPTHTISSTEIRHTVMGGTANIRTGWEKTAYGGGQAHNNLQPYITVYFYHRTA